MHRPHTALIAAILLLASCSNTTGQTNTDHTPTAMDRTTSPSPGEQDMNQYDHSKNPHYSHTDTSKLDLPLSEWKKLLPEELYYVAFEKGTERAFTGKFWDFDGVGTYACAACGNVLFQADAKFASSCGWPSFYQPERKNSVAYHDDNSFGMVRTEVTCGRCGAHLGHIFDDGPPPTGERYCINSVSLEFLGTK